MKRKAVDLYQGKNGKRLNCAQAIAHAAKELFDIAGADAAAFASCGAGMAAGGMCGALYAAKKLIALDSPKAAQEAEAAFKEEIGAVNCKDIKSQTKCPCADCVACAAGLVEDHFGKR